MSCFDHTIILYGAMSDFPDVTERGTVCWTFNSPFASSVHWRLQEIHRKDCFNKRRQETRR